jgi:hypothetical protein
MSKGIISNWQDKRQLCVLFGHSVIAVLFLAGCGSDEVRPTSPEEAPIIFPVTSVAQTCTTTTLRCYIDPRGQTTTVNCEYGTDLESAVSSWTGKIGGANGPVQVIAELKSLLPDTLHMFRWIALNSGGTTFSEVDSFTTMPLNCPPVTEITSAPLIERWDHYSVEVNWTGWDSDGFVVGFELRRRVRGVWTQWTTTDRNQWTSPIDFGDEVGWRFEVRAVDDAGAADPTPAWIEWPWQ